TLPVPPAGAFGYDVYVGPLQYRRLARLGHDLDDANPYGGFLRPIIQPVSVLVVNILIWMHDRLSLAYGWVLIIFGVLIRVLLWPLNQKAMESSIRMQAVAPLLRDVQQRYKAEPERLQRETLRIYKEHNVNPLGGCLPMLLPLPVLFAPFFVFANTIELRGVPFLWVPELSRPAPLPIIPLSMGLAGLAASKLWPRRRVVPPSLSSGCRGRPRSTSPPARSVRFAPTRLASCAASGSSIPTAASSSTTRSRRRSPARARTPAMTWSRSRRTAG